MAEDKLKTLLSIVVENYIDKGEPIGSKFLHSLEDTDYAPSTLRKYLNILEKEGLLYQPYNSAGRVPTVKGLSNYIDDVLALPKQENKEFNEIDFDIDYARHDLKSVVETLDEYTDGAVVGFLKQDEYFYLGINNLLKETLIIDHETTRYIVNFIESKKIIQELDAKLTKKGKVYYTFLEADQKLISAIYTKIEINGYDAMISILGPSRIDHKKNVMVLKKFMEMYN